MKRDPAQSAAANDQAWQKKAVWHAIHSECYRYGRPGVDPYFGSTGLPPMEYVPRGQYLGEDVYDSTLARAVTKLANRIVQDVCPPGVEWSEFVGGMVGGEGRSEDRKRLKTLQKRTFKAFHVSNGDQALHEMILDTVLSGTGVARVGAGREPAVPLELDSTSQVEVALEGGPRGSVWGFHRKFLMPREHFQAMWPQAELPEEPPQESHLAPHMPPLHSIYESTYFDIDEGAWWYDVLTRGTYRSEGTGEPTLLLQEQYPISRWIAWRWARLPGEIYGRSPVMDALPDAKTASAVVEALLKTASLRTKGIFTYKNDGIINLATTRMEAGSFIQVESNAQDNPSIRPLEVGGDVRLTEIVLEDLRMSIEKAMLGQGLPPEGSGIRSATEWVARMKQINQEVGAAFSRLVEELLRPLLQAVTYVLSEQGVLADVGIPQGQFMRLDGTDMDLVFTSPLVRSQKLQDVQGIVEASQMAQAAAGPMGFQAAANTPRIAAKIFELQSVDPDLSRDEDEAEQMYQQQMQAQAEAASAPNANDQPAGMERGNAP